MIRWKYNIAYGWIHREHQKLESKWIMKYSSYESVMKEFSDNLANDANHKQIFPLPVEFTSRFYLRFLLRNLFFIIRLSWFLMEGKHSQFFFYLFCKMRSCGKINRKIFSAIPKACTNWCCLFAWKNKLPSLRSTKFLHEMMMETTPN